MKSSNRTFLFNMRFEWNIFFAYMHTFFLAFLILGASTLLKLWNESEWEREIVVYGIDTIIMMFISHIT